MEEHWRVWAGVAGLPLCCQDGFVVKIAVKIGMVVAMAAARRVHDTIRLVRG